MQIKNVIKSMGYKITLLIIITITLFITGCGFKLRSNNSLPTQLHTVYLKTDNPYGEFETAFKRSLKAMDVNLLEQPDSKHLTLELSSTTFTSDNASIGGSIQARVYNLTFSVSFKITDNQGKIVVGAQGITVTKGLTLNPNEVFGASNQVTLVQRSMEQEAITRIFNILGSKRVFTQLATTT
jgi:LPS-assembly lipoprotein